MINRLDLDMASIYYQVKNVVKHAGFESEWAWQTSLDFNNFSERDLLREAAWVILCSGFRESTVKRIFDYVSLCFCDWESAEEILKHKKVCKQAALFKINHPKKIDAIVNVAQKIEQVGFLNLRESIIKQPLVELPKFDYIGEITALHLAKNLGLDVAKPDRHLMTMVSSVGFSDVNEFCKTISELTGDPIPLVDIILWRFATLHPQNNMIFAAFPSIRTIAGVGPS